MTKKKSDSGAAAMPMEREMQAMIGHRLRARYAEILAEPIPDKFLSLLEQLDTAESPDTNSRRKASKPDAPTLGREEQRR
ncbi:MAG TPA: NepR family anti-sigma factor [Methylomirabilota bacterium]|nr:NepR family anti-sigma factor [Methylomirabilota bacterium]